MSSKNNGVKDANQRLREKAQNEQLRKDAAVGSAIQRAAAELPRGYIVGITIETDAAAVCLGLPTGHIKHMDVDDENRLAAEINAAIDTAKRRAKLSPFCPVAASEEENEH